MAVRVSFRRGAPIDDRFNDDGGGADPARHVRRFIYGRRPSRRCEESVDGQNWGERSPNPFISGKALQEIGS